MIDALKHHLKTRRTVPAVNLGEPAPDEQNLREMLEIAARVPDHGKLAPWRFIIYRTQQGAAIGEKLADLWQKKAGQETPGRYEAEKQRFLRAPLVVGVLSNVVSEKIPAWEQHLSAGAVCMNLIHAAYAYGFNAQWLSEWYAFDEAAARYLGAQEGEVFAGFIHIGTPKIAPTERPRPDLDRLITHWNEEDERDVL